MRNLIWLLLLLVWPVFGQEDTLCHEQYTSHSPSYAAAKNKALTLRNSLRGAYSRAAEAEKAALLDSAGRIFADLLVDDILPYWFGTPWAFEGYTAVPGQGEVACGYLVSTSLLHAGLNVNRYKLAQQNPENEARSVMCSDQAPTKFDNVSIWAQAYLLDDGLYFVGLDNHVGFLYKTGTEVKFIHSSFVGDMEVVCEDIRCSQVFGFASVYIITPISTNQDFIKSWLRSSVVEIKKS